ncbi:MAG: D-alanyl-D-alanine carboxypeptidase/D-alanyl-D-alanine-endopeptidase [Alphaproteobacteria bacterium]|nr:D-alanyl-D-alanine carboxypeptidase/D-alanyl-D-alanine-endopeptidase [Alphaproteobacteria bacterium]
MATLITDHDREDERFFRPPLSIDKDAIQPIAEALPDGAEVSYVVVDLDRGTTVAEHNADQSHIPASSAKLATAVVALQLLGPEHRFRTELRTAGPIANGVLKGDLILKGGGDPFLDLPDLLPLIDKLARQPVRSIEGQFLIDDTLLPRFTEIEPSQPTEAAYNPGLGALSIAFNRVHLRWNNRRALAVETVPRLDEASFEDAAPDLLPPGGVQLKQLDDQKAVWQLADRGARRSKRSLPVKDAGLYAGHVFADLARLRGIDLPRPRRVTRSHDGRLLAVHESRPLRVLVRNMLWYSNNLVAELIGLAAAETVEPELASLETSAGIVLAELEKRLPDISWDEARLDNHSGLSSKARLSPEQLAAILRYGWNDGMLSSLLPGSGWSGTLARRFNGPDQALRIWAKTGSINYVATLGGYLLSPDHGPVAFVIMVSDEQARAAYEAQARRTRDLETKARVWKDDAEKAMSSIVESLLGPSIARPPQNLYVLSHDSKADAH